MQIICLTSLLFYKRVIGMKKWLWLLLLIFTVVGLRAQTDPKNDDLIQFSGIIITGDSLVPVPFVNVIIEESHRGTMSDVNGYFSFVAQKGDSITFSAIGFRKQGIVLPDTLTENKYSMIQILHPDTIELSEAVIYPWPTREQFREAFLALELPETDAERAARNLARADMISRMEAMPADGSENFKYQMQNYQNRIYYAGQAPPMQIFNPFAWAKFIEAWRDGAFKKRDKTE